MATFAQGVVNVTESLGLSPQQKESAEPLEPELPIGAENIFIYLSRVCQDWLHWLH
jgi:hypothetical protein